MSYVSIADAVWGIILGLFTFFIWRSDEDDFAYSLKFALGFGVGMFVISFLLSLGSIEPRPWVGPLMSSVCMIATIRILAEFVPRKNTASSEESKSDDTKEEK